MSLADPLAKATLADQLRIADTRFALQWAQEMSGTGAGQPLYADLAPARWMADLTTVAMEHAEAFGMIALLNSRRGGIKSFLLYDHRMPYPSSDPDGAIFGAATPAVGTITDSTHLAFTGFPNGYSIPLGTYFQIIYGTSRYYLGQFAEAKTANGSGAVSAVEISPPLPASVVTSNAVTILKPSGKFNVVPNTAFVSTIDPLLSRVTFSAEQTHAA
jgi:hypothetical protein